MNPTGIPLSVYRKYIRGIKIVNPRIYDSIFNTHGSSSNAKAIKHRIYIPIEKTANNPAESPEEIVNRYLSKHNYVITDYLRGICIMPDKKRTIRIGKVLAKEPTLLAKFVNDPRRAASRNISKGEVLCCISRHPYDILRCSFNRGWKSCLTLGEGGNDKELPASINGGLLVAYLINETDKNINRPMARIFIRPYYNNKGVILSMDKAIFGNAPDQFIKTVQQFVDYANSGSPKGIYSSPPGMFLNTETAVIPYAVDKSDIETIRALKGKIKIDALRGVKNPEIISYFLRNSNNKVRLAMFGQNLNIPTSELLQYVSESKFDVLQFNIARHNNADKTVLMWSIRNKRMEVRLCAVANPNATPEILLIGAKDTEREIRQAAMEHPNATPEILIIGAKDTDWRIRKTAMKHPNATPEILILCAKDKHHTVRNSVANNPNMTKEIERIVRSSDAIFSGIDWLLVQARDKDSDIRIYTMEHPVATPEILLIGARDKNKWVRRAAMEHPNATPEILLIGARDENWRVRVTAMYNPNATKEILIIGAQDKDWYIRESAMCNPKVTIDMLMIGARDEHWRVRVSTMYNPNATEEILMIGAKDRRVKIRCMVMAHSNATESVLMLGAQDTNWDVRLGVMENSKATPEMLMTGIRDKKWIVRAAAVRNSNATEAILMIGINDTNPAVQRNAMLNPNITKEIKEIIRATMRKHNSSILSRC